MAQLRRSELLALLHLLLLVLIDQHARSLPEKIAAILADVAWPVDYDVLVLSAEPRQASVGGL